jgi:succinate dehydrogenase/fumarate reductase flavoprotein subunit
VTLQSAYIHIEHSSISETKLYEKWGHIERRKTALKDERWIKYRKRQFAAAKAMKYRTRSAGHKSRKTLTKRRDRNLLRFSFFQQKNGKYQFGPLRSPKLFTHVP